MNDSRDSRAPNQPYGDLPKAKVSKDWKTWLFWLVPLAAACLAAYFIYSNTNKGPDIHIFFADASGMVPGRSTVKYRGGDIGEVKNVELTPDQKQIDVTVSLKKSAAGLARENSRFWIVRAVIGVSGIQGLGTIVSGDYITVEPGGGKPATKFEGLAQGPVVPSPGALSFVLITERMQSLQPRAPVFYRGVQIGEVSRCFLGPQAQTAQVIVEIQKAYAPLVRVNSVFWRAGGINMTFGLNGADISAQSFRTLVSGGIDFATPDAIQKPAPPGFAFRLYEKPKDEWLAWSPAIDLGPPESRPSLNSAGTTGGGL